jgi:predicted lipid-binding transport protein (Tim44 family)
VLEVAAEVVEVAEQGGQRVVSVRYRGRVREEAGAEPVAVDELWHLVQPLDGERPWASAGIQQLA